jgi:hypothetical protein
VGFIILNILASQLFRRSVLRTHKFSLQLKAKFYVAYIQAKPTYTRC